MVVKHWVLSEADRQQAIELLWSFFRHDEITYIPSADNNVAAGQDFHKILYVLVKDIEMLECYLSRLSSYCIANGVVDYSWARSLDP